MTGRGFPPALAVALALSFLGTCAACRTAHAGESPRIVNGVPTQERPTTGALLIGFDGFLGGICSGTLVGCQHFVTAAHCVCVGADFATCGTPDPTRYRVYLQHAGVLGVSAIAVHPSFSFGTAGDVAVLTLTSAVTGIRPTPLNTIADPSVGTVGTVAGFGITGGASNDFGLLREGAVTISSCGAVASEPAHVCWTFDGAIGPPGTDSNSCSGDSGGSLLVNSGGQDLLAGVTSGGVSSNCLPLDVSFAGNIFQNRAYIESIGGADLSSTACGSIPQVGAAGTHVTAVSFSSPSTSELSCRRFVAKAYTTYTNAKLRLMQRCLGAVNEGLVTGPCPDAVALARMAKAERRVRFLAATIGIPCTPAVVGAMGAANACAGARDLDELQGCILAAANTAVDDLLDAEYAETDPGGAIADVGLRACQVAIAKAASRYGIARLRLLIKCQTSADKGKILSCPDAATQAKIATNAGKLPSGISVACTDEQIATLNSGGSFGGGCGAARSVATLASCETARHDAETDVLFALLDPVAARRHTSVSIPPNTARLRITLNGIDTGVNDLHIYARRDVPPTATVSDARSTNGGVYEGIDLVAPASGTWHVLVSPVAGGNVPYQLTVTAFGP